MSGDPARRSPGAVGGNQERFDETVEQFRARVRRDRIIGRSVFAVSMVVLVLNYVMEVAPSLRLLPGGHSELYFLATIAAAGGSAWVAFDLGNRRRTRR